MASVLLVFLFAKGQPRQTSHMACVGGIASK